MAEEKLNRHPKHTHGDDYELNDMDKYFAMTWGSPSGLAMLMFSFAIFLVSIGVFFWLLHIANVIK